MSDLTATEVRDSGSFDGGGEGGKNSFAFVAWFGIGEQIFVPTVVGRVLVFLFDADSACRSVGCVLHQRVLYIQ